MRYVEVKSVENVQSHTQTGILVKFVWVIRESINIFNIFFLSLKLINYVQLALVKDFNYMLILDNQREN